MDYWRSTGINTLVLARLRWPLLKCPPLAGFQTSTEGQSVFRQETCGTRGGRVCDREERRTGIVKRDHAGLGRQERYREV